jgi:DNA-binding transcriptional LysR family regulator
MHVTIRQYQQIGALDRYRHFGRAAEALAISQPALSRSIQALEKQLGVTLFERSKRGVSPTRAGLLLLKHGHRILSAVADLESDFNELEGRGGSTLAIVCGHYPAELSVPGALSRLMQDRPQLQFQMEVTNWTRVAELLEHGTSDLAITELTASSRSIQLASELLNDREILLLVHPAHPLTKLRDPDLDDLLAYPWVSSQIPPRAASLFGDAPVPAGDVDPDSGIFVPKIVVSSVATALRLLGDSDAVGIAPISTAWPFLQRGELCRVRYRAPWMRLNYGFMWDAQRPLPPVARVFMQRVREAEARIAQRERDVYDQLFA